MTPERWQRVDAVLQEALQQPAEERAAFLARACGDDEEVLAEVRSLLAHDVRDGFLEEPARPAASLSRDGQLAQVLGDRYRIDAEIARGGMATVYRAWDLRHERPVALKVLRDEVAALVGPERFLAEIRVTAALQHPHILPLFDSGSSEGVLWYAMPLVDGESLRDRLARDGPLPPDEARRITREVADALAHAHRRGIVHRDVKPENILLQDGHARVADFGVALALSEAGGERLTRTGIRVGTPRYMAPEQARGDRTIDARADVYALGAVLHEMLTGRSHLAPTAVVAGESVAPAFMEAVSRALHPVPAERHASIAEFANALDREAAREGPDAGALLPPRTDGEGARRPRALLGALLLMLGVGLGGGWVIARSTLVQRITPAPAAPAAPVPGATPGTLEGLQVLDRSGTTVTTISATRPWTPRFSPDGRSIAYGAFEGRGTSDLWVTDVGSWATTRLTDDDRDANDPQWAASGRLLAYSIATPGGKDLAVRDLGTGVERPLAGRPGVQYPTDWGQADGDLLVTEEGSIGRRDILLQPAGGGPAREWQATMADESSARRAPVGGWVAFTSDEGGRPEVWIAHVDRPTERQRISTRGGMRPAWRGDGRELFYWEDDVLVAVTLAPSTTLGVPGVARRTPLWRVPGAGAAPMYDVSPDGQRFVIVMPGPSR